MFNSKRAIFLIVALAITATAFALELKKGQVTNTKKPIGTLIRATSTGSGTGVGGTPGSGSGFGKGH
mgnify:CR=1 FL=1